MKIKKAKGAKKCIKKRDLKFQDYKNCLNEPNIDGKLKYLEKKGFNVDKLKEFVENKTILKAKQRFKVERHNFFSEVINKIALSTNDDKRIQLINSIERYAYGMSEDTIHAKEKIKRYNFIQNYYISKENIK